jgi:hypothetical protein
MANASHHQRPPQGQPSVHRHCPLLRGLLGTTVQYYSTVQYLQLYREEVQQRRGCSSRLLISSAGTDSLTRLDLTDGYSSTCVMSQVTSTTVLLLATVLVASSTFSSPPHQKHAQKHRSTETKG